MTWIITYVIFCVIIAVLGCGRRPGIAGWFLISLILTPLVGLAIFLVTQTTLIPAAKPERRIALSSSAATPVVHTSVHSGHCPQCHRRLKKVEVEIDVCPRCGAHA